VRLQVSPDGSRRTANVLKHKKVPPIKSNGDLWVAPIGDRWMATSA
jgi:hypothetical protein